MYSRLGTSDPTEDVPTASAVNTGAVPPAATFCQASLFAVVMSVSLMRTMPLEPRPLGVPS